LRFSIGWHFPSIAHQTAFCEQIAFCAISHQMAISRFLCTAVICVLSTTNLLGKVFRDPVVSQLNFISMNVVTLEGKLGHVSWVTVMKVFCTHRHCWHVIQGMGNFDKLQAVPWLMVNLFELICISACAFRSRFPPPAATPSR
jgi:hypothetical protein